MIQGRVFSIERYAVHDGHGIRTLVFLKGCPLRCLWCANPEGQQLEPQLLYAAQHCIGCRECVNVCPAEALVFGPEGLQLKRENCQQCGACETECYAEALQLDSRLMSVDEVMQEVAKDLAFYRRSNGGVTLSGGEPLLQREFALALLQGCQERFIHTAIETCGHYDWTILEEALPWLNLIFYDVKHISSPIHERITGVGNSRVLDNLHRLAQHDVPVIVRVPIIPGFNDEAENIRRIAALVRQLSDQWPVELLPYHSLGTGKYRKLGMKYDLMEIEAPSIEQMKNLREMVRAAGVSCLPG